MLASAALSIWEPFPLLAHVLQHRGLAVEKWMLNAQAKRNL